MGITSAVSYTLTLEKTLGIGSHSQSQRSCFLASVFPLDILLNKWIFRVILVCCCYVCQSIRTCPLMAPLDTPSTVVLNPVHGQVTKLLPLHCIDLSGKSHGTQISLSLIVQPTNRESGFGWFNTHARSEWSALTETVHLQGTLPTSILTKQQQDTLARRRRDATAMNHS